MITLIEKFGDLYTKRLVAIQKIAETHFKATSDRDVCSFLS